MSHDLTTVPEPHLGESTHDYCARLPRRRRSYEAKGLVLLLPRTGMVVVPHQKTRGGWAVVVVRADRRGVYPVGGYDLSVGDAEIETAIEQRLADD